jgi:hypothetical protein
MGSRGGFLSYLATVTGGSIFARLQSGLIGRGCPNSAHCRRAYPGGPATAWVERAVSVSDSLSVAQGFGHADPPNRNVHPRRAQCPSLSARGSNVSVRPVTCLGSPGGGAPLKGAAATGGQRPGRRRLRTPPVGSGPGTLTHQTASYYGVGPCRRASRFEGCHPQGPGRLRRSIANAPTRPLRRHTQGSR